MNENILLLRYFKIFELECRLMLAQGACCAQHVYKFARLLRRYRMCVRDPLVNAISLGEKEPILPETESQIIKSIGDVRTMRSHMAGAPKELLVTDKKVFTLLHVLGDMELVEDTIAIEQSGVIEAALDTEEPMMWLENPGSVN